MPPSRWLTRRLRPRGSDRVLIGLVYDLRSEYLALGHTEEAVAEFDSEETIAALAGALAGIGHAVERIGNGRALARRLVDGQRFDLVFSIAEGLTGRAREAQVPALCELFEQAYVFSDPMTLAVALDKGAAKSLVRDAGVPTAAFMVVEPGAEVPVPAFAFPVFAKPLAEGTGKGCELSSVCHDQAALVATVRALAMRFRQPVIVEPFLPGREFTVGIVGTGQTARVVGVIEILLKAEADAGVYSYRNKEACESLVTYRKADDETARAAANAALQAYAALGCRDAGRLDLRCDATGQPCFLEANPLAGLHPSHSDLPIAATLHGLSYGGLLGAIVDSAAARYGLVVSPDHPRSPARLFVPVLHAAALARADEADTVEAAEAVAAALERRGYASEVRRFEPSTRMLDSLVASRPAVVFNLVEALDGEAQGALLAPWLLARRGLRYTGNTFEGLLATASKLLTKGLLANCGIATPLLAEASDGPVIVKPVWEHGSLGLDALSVVDSADVARLVAAREAAIGGACFAEAYIEGREFNIALLGDGARPQVLPIQETLFTDWPAERPHVVDFEAKWAPGSAAYRNTPRRFGLEAREAALAAALADCAVQVWSRCGLRGYARIDVRVGSDSRIYVIDVNANPGLGPDAGFVAAAAHAGIDFDSLIVRLVDGARGDARAAA